MSSQYELFMNLITVANIFSVFVLTLQTQAEEETIKIWIIVQLCINWCLLFETLGDLYFAGLAKAYKNHFRIWPETLCQLLNIPAMVNFFTSHGEDTFVSYNYTVKVLQVIIFIRMLKLLTLTYEIKVMRVIFETLKNLLGPLNNLIVVMLTIFYVFAQMGMIIFGGKITEDAPEILHDQSIPDNYYLMNFNDLMSSLITEFVLIVVNNWYVIVAMCVDIENGNLWVRYFFVVFYYFGVIIGLNIIIAFAIDMYAAVQRLEEKKEENRNYLVQLAEENNRQRQMLAMQE